MHHSHAFSNLPHLCQLEKSSKTKKQGATGQTDSADATSISIGNSQFLPAGTRTHRTSVADANVADKQQLPPNTFQINKLSPPGVLIVERRANSLQYKEFVFVVLI